MIGKSMHRELVKCFLLVSLIVGCGSRDAPPLPAVSSEDVDQTKASPPVIKEDMRDTVHKAEPEQEQPLIKLSPPQIQSYLDQGGSTWSSTDEIKITDGRYSITDASTQQMWLWPENGDFISYSNGKIKVTLNWMVRPGQSIEDHVVIGSSLQSPAQVGVRQMGSSGYEEGMAEGICEASFDISNLATAKEVVISLNKGGRNLSSTPVSNFLRIKLPVK